MSELDVLQAIQTETGLLGRGASADEIRRNAARFTKIAAWRLREGGWGNLRKLVGNNVDGLSVDRLLHQTTGERRDIVFASDEPRARAQWGYDGVGDVRDWVAPVPEEPPPPPPPPAPGDLEARLARLEDRYLAGLDAIDRLIEFSREIIDDLKARG